MWCDVIWYDVMWCDVRWCVLLLLTVSLITLSYTDPLSYYFISHRMIWYDMIWCDMMWYDVMWCDMISFVMLWYDMVWYDIISSSSILVVKCRQLNSLHCLALFNLSHLSLCCWCWYSAIYCFVFYRTTLYTITWYDLTLLLYSTAGAWSWSWYWSWYVSRVVKDGERAKQSRPLLTRPGHTTPH